MVAEREQSDRAVMLDDELPPLVVVRQNITLFRANKMLWEQFRKPTQRYARVKDKPYLRADCSLVAADAEILAEAGLPASAQYVESQVVNVGFWSPTEARLHRGKQCCATNDESLAAEADAFAQT